MIKERDIFGRIKSKYKNEDFIPLCEEYKINKNANFYLKRKYSKLT